MVQTAERVITATPYVDFDLTTGEDLSQPYPAGELAPVTRVSAETLAVRSIRSSCAGRDCLLATNGDPRACDMYPALVEKYREIQAETAAIRTNGSALDDIHGPESKFDIEEITWGAGPAND